MNIKVEHNTGIISTGSGAHNTVVNITGMEDMDWNKLADEVAALKANSDASIKKFANEAVEPIKKKDTGGIKNWLLKWIPCIGELLESSYYILEIAARFGIL